MSIRKNTYVIKNPTTENLRNLGFRYSSTLSNGIEKVYVYRFPVLKYKRKPLLECELSVETNNNTVLVNVYNYSNHSSYAPFYYDFYGNYEVVLKIINKNILREFRKLGVIKIE